MDNSLNGWYQLDKAYEAEQDLLEAEQQALEEFDEENREEVILEYLDLGASQQEIDELLDKEIERRFRQHIKEQQEY